MKKYYADKTCLNILRVISLMVTICLVALIEYYLYNFYTLMCIAITIIICAFIFFGLIWLPLYFNSANYIVSSQELIRSTGFFFCVKKIMKVSAIQYITLVTTPFSKFTGINFVIINALGGNLLLLFLSKHDAQEITRALNEQINARKTVQ